MTFVYPDIDFVFNTEERGVHTLVIENQCMFRNLLIDLYNQSQGNDGRSVVAYEYKPLPFEKYCEVLSQFVPFSLNKKSVVTKIGPLLAKRAVDSEYFLKTTELMTEIESLMYELAFDLDADIEFNSINVESLIKSVGVSLKEEYESLAEKIIDYMELVNNLERKKLYILINLRSYISDEEMIYFIETVLQHEFDVIIIESAERPILKGEIRYIVDESLCEIR